jgi:hypothetical protein
MNNNQKHLRLITLAIASFIILTAFTRNFNLFANGNIDGYVFPKESKPFVEVRVANNDGDTVLRKAVPNASGYFKFTQIPAGSYLLEYWPKDPNYSGTTKPIAVIENQTANAGSVTLHH